MVEKIKKVKKVKKVTMSSIELERTFLAKYLPDNLRKFSSKEIGDVYVDNKSKYSNLRLRKNGSKYEITRKESINNDDASKHIETTINLVAEEFNQLTKFTDRVLLKRRFDYTFNNVRFEIDVFIGRLEGLVLVDVEFIVTGKQIGRAHV